MPSLHQESLNHHAMSPDNDLIAVIGFASGFPREATSTESFWHMIPVRGGNFIRGDLEAFDAPFFSITPGEAACMDPQHRHMLEATYHALKAAGIPISKCCGSNTSVYTGCSPNDYLSILQQDYEAEQRILEGWE
ncbi:thiolase-like protein [Aspergillus fruticulosus]